MSTWLRLARLTPVTVSQRYCVYCGTEMTEEVVVSDRHDMATGEWFRFTVRTCPNRKGGWFDKHSKVRLLLPIEE